MSLDLGRKTGCNGRDKRMHLSFLKRFVATVTKLRDLYLVVFYSVSTCFTEKARIAQSV